MEAERALHFCCANPVSTDIDDIVYSASDPVEAILISSTSIPREVVALSDNLYELAHHDHTHRTVTYPQDSYFACWKSSTPQTNDRCTVLAAPEGLINNMTHHLYNSGGTHVL